MIKLAARVHTNNITHVAIRLHLQISNTTHCHEFLYANNMSINITYYLWLNIT